MELNRRSLLAVIGAGTAAALTGCGTGTTASGSTDGPAEGEIDPDRNVRSAELVRQVVAQVTEDEWDAAKRKFPYGSTVNGAVNQVAPFGIFISVEGLQQTEAFADVAGMHHGGADGSTVLWPEVGDAVTGVVVEHTERNHQLKLHLR